MLGEEIIGKPTDHCSGDGYYLAADFTGKINFIKEYIEEIGGQGYVSVRAKHGFCIKSYTRKVKEKGPFAVGIGLNTSRFTQKTSITEDEKISRER